MFNKYTALAAALMLASTAALSLAEDTTARQDCCTTADALSAANMGCNTTCMEICTTYGCGSSTCEIVCATCGDCNPTWGTIYGEYPACEPTAVPLPTAVPQPTQRPSATQSPSTGDDYTTQSVSAQEQKMVNLLNQDRKNNGLAPLTLDPELCRIARIKSADMRDNHYFAHESPTYGRVGEMLKRFGYSYSAAGENIAHHANVDKAQAAFMSSTGHRRNILSTAWTKVGIGIVTDANGFIYATQIFVK